MSARFAVSTESFPPESTSRGYRFSDPWTSSSPGRIKAFWRMKPTSTQGAMGFVWDPTTALQEVDRTKTLRENWDGYGARVPSEDARVLARGIVLRLAQRSSLKPLRVVPSVGGGLGILFAKKGRLADIEVLNSGVVVVGLQARGEPADAWTTDPDERGLVATAERIATFLSR